MSIADQDWHTIWITVLAALIVAGILYVIRSWHKLMRRLDAQDRDQAEQMRVLRDQAHAVTAQSATAARLDAAIDGLRATVAKEFGGNSGGMRERINAIDSKVNEVSTRQVGISTALADLKGRFTQHLEDQSDKPKPGTTPRKRSTPK